MIAAALLLITIFLRIVLEDLLCVGKNGFSSGPEIGHMVLWWISIFLTFTLIVSKHSKKPLMEVFLFTTCISPGILTPPIYDYLMGPRTFDYPYPSGGFLDYVAWMLDYMPEFVTVGQKIEITGMFLIILVYILLEQRKWAGVLFGLQAVLVTYVLFSFYAWFPMVFRSFWSFAVSSHDVFIMIVMGLLITAQLVLIFMRRSNWHV